MLNLKFLASRDPSWSICMPNFTFLASPVPKIWRGSPSGDMEGSKVRQVNLSPPPLIYFFIFFVASVIKIRAKFAGSSNSHSRDMMGVSKFKIVGNMTPSRPRSGVSFTAHFDLILHFFVSAPCGLYACQICSF